MTTETIIATGTASGWVMPGPACAEAYVNGIKQFQYCGTFSAAQYVSGSGSATLTLSPGQNTITAIGWASNCSASDSITVYYDALSRILRMTSSLPIIPKDSGLINGYLLTRSDLSLRLTYKITSGTEEPVSGGNLTLQSNRGSIDTIYQPASTNSNGETTARVETRDQSSNGGVSTITSNTPGVNIEQPAVITWLPARYESKFDTTCYSTELESDYPNSPYKAANTWNWCRGVKPPSKKYRAHFMNEAVYFQGSGVAEGGEVVQYNSTNACYYISSCPLMASGQCAQVGVTIAIDVLWQRGTRNPVIPFRGTVDIETLGIRKAMDTGGRIVGYHIDVYKGVGRSACLNEQYS